jgi:hypothetical protein
MRQQDGTEQPIRLRNISRSGFMGETSEPIHAGSTIYLLLPFGGIVAADVRWALNHRIGCKLEGSFSNRQLTLMFLLAELPAEARLFVVMLAAAAAVFFA